MSERTWQVIVGVAIVVLLLPIINGCSLMAARAAPENTSYAKASEGEASGIVKAVSGGAKYCMIQVHTGKTGVTASVTYGPDRACEASASIDE